MGSPSSDTPSASNAVHAQQPSHAFPQQITLNPSSLVPSSALKNLTATALIASSLVFSATAKPAIALANPHPGSISMLEDAAKWTAEEIGADFVSVDYLDMVSFVENVKKNIASSESAQPPAAPTSLIHPSSIVVSKPFSPSSYTPHKDAAASNNLSNAFDDFEDDEDFEEDEDEDSGHRDNSRGAGIFGNMINASGPSGAIHNHFNHTFPITVKVVVDGKEAPSDVSVGGTQDPISRTVVSNNNASSSSADQFVPSEKESILPLTMPASTISSSASKPTSGRSRVRINIERPISASESSISAKAPYRLNADMWDRRHFLANPDRNHYNVELRSIHVEKVMEDLLRIILEKSVSIDKTSGEERKRRVVLYLKDTTDTLKVAQESGKRVLAGLLNLVRVARDTHKVPIVLVAGCSPSLFGDSSAGNAGSLSSLATSANPENALTAFELFDNTQFSRLFTEKVVSSGSSDIESSNSSSSSSSNNGTEPFSLVQSGHLFKTVLDNLAHVFEKIEVPPMVSVVAPCDVAAASDSTTLSDDGKQQQQQQQVVVSPSWLRDATESLTKRHVELNWRVIQLCAQAQGIRFQSLVLDDLLMCASSNGDDVIKHRGLFPEEMDSLVSTLLGHSVWSLDRVRRFVGLSVGSQMMVGVGRVGESAQSSEGATADGRILVEVGVTHFIEALKVLKEETWGGLVFNATESAAIKAAAAALQNSGTGELTSKESDAEARNRRGGKDGDEGGSSLGLTVDAAANGGAGSANPRTVTVAPIASLLSVSTSSTTGAAAAGVQVGAGTNVVDNGSEGAIQRLKANLKRKGIKLNTYESKMLSTVVTPASIPVEFSHLVLPPPTKLMLQTLVSLPLMRPDLFQTGILAKHSIAGVLMFGPPGTGKTLLAKAAAKSSGANFMAVALSDVFDKYVGEGEKNVRAIFTLARKLSPCVVFLDEVDALFGARRGGDVTSSKREIINEFMSEWDGLNSNNKGVIVLGATNRPFDLDDAILRRMPRRILIDLPTEDQRKQILQVHLQDEQLESTVDLADLAKRTSLYSGSDLKNVCISAALAAVKESLVRESMVATSSVDAVSQVSSNEIMKRLESLDDWKSIVDTSATSRPATAAVAGVSKRVLSMVHFEVALKEVPPSLTDEMQTLIELRKWDDMYGDAGASGGKKKARGKKGWGFQEVL
ncbi:hypothetical protein HDU81_005381 [Chytriomyces hyalinus]|nr:hypothetical protein HDU81_005381 [Chytriomyces hyalinus]